jgi:transposase-like protein
VHRNAPLTPEGRLRLCLRILDGWTVVAAAESMNVSRQCAHKWWRRYQTEGIAGLEDRSSRSHSCPHRTAARLERRIVALRRSRKLGPARLGGIVGVPASTVHRILVRHGVSRLRWMDRATGRPVRHIETHRCGELVHIDVKKLAGCMPAVATRGWDGHPRPSDAAEPAAATPTSIPPSMPTPGSPTASSPARRTPPTASRSSLGPSPGSPPKASPSSGS